jgi:hypothetical protein
MAKKKAAPKQTTRKATGTLVLNKADMRTVSAGMKPGKGSMEIASALRVLFGDGACPAGYRENPEHYEVTGKYLFELTYKKI